MWGGGNKAEYIKRRRTTNCVTLDAIFIRYQEKETWPVNVMIPKNSRNAAHKKQ